MTGMGGVAVPPRTTCVSGRAALVRDLEILDAQSFHFELLDNEALDRSAVDRQPPDRERTERGGSHGQRRHRCRPAHRRAARVDARGPYWPGVEPTGSAPP